MSTYTTETVWPAEPKILILQYLRKFTDRAFKKIHQIRPLSLPKKKKKAQLPLSTRERKSQCLPFACKTPNVHMNILNKWKSYYFIHLRLISVPRVPHSDSKELMSKNSFFRLRWTDHSFQNLID